MEVFYQFLFNHPFVSFTIVSILVYFLVPQVLWALRKALLKFLNWKGLGRRVLVRNSSTIPVFVALFDSSGFRQVSRATKVLPEEKKSLALSSSDYRGEPCVAWSEQKADLRRGAPSFRFRRVGVGLSRNFRDLEFVFRHPTVGSSRHLGAVEMVTTFELSVLGRVDDAVRSAPLLEPQKESSSDEVCCCCGRLFFDLLFL